MKVIASITLGLCTVLASIPASAQSIGTSVLKLPQDIEFKGPADKPQTAPVHYRGRAAGLQLGADDARPGRA